MEDQMAAGLLIIDGNTRVRHSNPPSLVKLEDLSGSGPAGPAGPAGPEGPAGTVDESQYYNKTTTNLMLGLKEDNIVTTPGTGTVLFNNGMLRRLISGTGLTLTLDNNDNIIITATGGGAGGIGPTIATFTASQINLKKDVICGGTLTAPNHLGCGTFVCQSASIQGGLM